VSDARTSRRTAWLLYTRMIENIFNSLSCQRFDLNMSVGGFEGASHAMKEADEKMPQVYVHVGSEGAIKNQVLRVGKAESGAYTRWMTSGNGHKNTFYWSIGESDKYNKKNAEDYPHYLLFFASLNKLETTLFTLTYSTKAEARTKETKIRNLYSPIWEQFLMVLRSDSTYPKLTGKYRDTKIIEPVSKLGGAFEVIKLQRARVEPSERMFPDIMNMNIRSGVMW